MKKYTFLFLMIFVVGSNLSLKAQSLYTNISGGTAISQNSAVNIADLLTVGTGATSLTAARVSISSNFVNTQDELGINGSTSGTDGSIIYLYNSTSGVLTLTGSGTAAEYQAILRKVTYKNTSASPNTSNRTITFSLNAAVPYSGNNHFYEFISSTNPTWTDARDAAATRNYFGLQGYLVTVTSAEESAFVSAKLAGQGWLGASDAAVEGTWRWVTGPETNNLLTYTNWNTNEPNNSGGTEHYGQFLTDGKWNDLPNSATGIVGYVVEYGGSTGDLVPHISDVVTVSINYRPADPTSITASQNPICIGTGTQLTANGAVGTVYWYTGSCGGTFVTTGNPINVSPATTTTYYAQNYNNSLFSAGCASIGITVNPLPPAATGIENQAVTGGPSVTFNVTNGTGYTVQWSTDGTTLNGTVGTPNILSLTYPAAPVVVYARLYNATTTCIGPWSLPYYGTAYNPTAPPVIGSTRYGQSSGGGSNFINKNGKPGDIPLLSNYGKDFSVVSTDLAALTISLASIAPSGSGASSFSRITVSSTPVLARGVCWSLASGPDPVITNSHTVDGSGVVDYTSTISEPVSGTYKVRAWAINSSGLHYSNVLTVTISSGK